MNMAFDVKDCTLITRMAGLRAVVNIRELQDRVGVCPPECLFHHFCETMIRPTFDDPEFYNDFAVWAIRTLRDRVLAERLAMINPYKVDSLEDLRQQVLDILEERIYEERHVPWANPGQEFYFMQAVTVVFDTGIALSQPQDLVGLLPQLSRGSIYYHFVEARRRTPNGMDDFSVWLMEFGDEAKPLIKALAGIEFYFLTLTELQDKLVTATRGGVEAPAYE